ncbi:MAG: D-2-hydroxyacid dehydrogenase family protein [Acetobacteraceae bacterium]|nr:D-2-hydroxyacid dehydrogenase family protein [Acetobacteraceae bacterium]
MAELRRIGLLDDWQGVGTLLADWSALPPGTEVESLRWHETDEAALAERLAPYDALVVMRERTPITASLVARLPRLKLLVTTGLRNAAVDVAACAARGITVCGTPSLASPTPELTWGLILGLLRRIPEESAAMRAGGWQTTIGRGVEGKTLGILGLGRIGQRVAKVGAAFGMKIIAWSRNLTAEAAAAAGAERVEKMELFARADVVTIHLVLSERTKGLVGAAELARMKPSAVLVNTSRGPIVDEAALLSALHAGEIAGAALDVYDEEPLPPDHPLRRAPNLLLTPHLGYVTEENYRGMYGGALECVLGWLKGEPVRVIAP